MKIASWPRHSARVAMTIGVTTSRANTRSADVISRSVEPGSPEMNVSSPSFGAGDQPKWSGVAAGLPSS